MCSMTGAKRIFSLEFYSVGTSFMSTVSFMNVSITLIYILVLIAFFDYLIALSFELVPFSFFSDYCYPDDLLLEEEEDPL